MMEKNIYDAKSDSVYQEPYVDVDEWRERALSNGRKLPFRYIHGGFRNTGVKFSFCYPEKENYTGRFFQYLSPFPGPDEENASLQKEGENDKIAFALANGAYYVESNMGSAQMFGRNQDSTIVYKSSAAAAEYSREKAAEIYGCGRPFGYVYGGSGGGYKTMACIENTNAWDGAVPYVIGSPVSLPNTITMHAQGQRALRRVFGKIVDALDAGGSGDMYEGLEQDEAAILKEITAMGFSPKIWFVEAGGRIDPGSLPVLAPGVKMADPGYFKDFWEVPGYLGADKDSSAVRDRLQFHGIVKRVHVPGSDLEAEDGTKEADGRNGVDDAWKKMLTDGHDAWIELEEVPTGEDLYLQGVNISFETGEAVGKQLLLGGIEGNALVIGMCYGMDDLPGVLSMVKPGDRVFLDNSDFIAIQSYYRHQVPEDLGFHAWDQFRDEKGNPVLPQRKNVMGYGMTGTGTVQDGNIQGKVIVIQALMDESTCPWCADWYRGKVRESKGSDEDFRLYYMENCMHGDESVMENNMVTNYMGALRQALLDLSDWVERGKEPLSTTVYQYREGQIIPAESIRDRKGIQPKVTLLVNEGRCDHIKAGETVKFTTKVEVPEGAGEVTAIDYDFEDKWTFPAENVYPVQGDFERTVDGEIRGAVSYTTYTFEKPGTYFVSVRAKVNRYGNGAEVFTQVKNIARARVVVEKAADRETDMKKVEKYDVFEISLDGIRSSDLVEYCAEFRNGVDCKRVPAFWYKNREYRIRFMPEKTGLWKYSVQLDTQNVEGEFLCVENEGENHGPVRTEGFHFRYEDGTRYIPVGTTCYAWIHQTEDLQRQTLATLRETPFNKIRMCVFPKSMVYNDNNPTHYPYFKNEAGQWDLKSPDPVFWENMDTRIRDLMELGIEADLILFHPYDRWGFALLNREESHTYLEYCIARLCAYRNVWWSLANEYEMLYEKTSEDWDSYGEMLQKLDPYHHPVSIHNFIALYPKRDWMTHCSVQSGEIHKVRRWKKEYGIPVIIDECGYEGNIEYNWGNLSAFEMVHRFWWAIALGGYCTHGETFHREDEVLWWAKGGVLYGESVERIAFLKELLYGLPGQWEAVEPALGNPNLDVTDEEAVKNEKNFLELMASQPEYTMDYFLTFHSMRLKGEGCLLQYFGRSCPGHAEFGLEKDRIYRVEVIDIWEMTRTVVAQNVSGKIRIELPGKEGVAVLIQAM